ncbi:hypothetical protein F5Y04DRAFT_275205 [Hypomontagnella monticulosa]|nr:hypothetical protein F5Y04DRAFT_275205 [Hypomontagnella monticulosa]
MPLQSFELFNKFPYDIRRLIWDAYLDSYPGTIFHIGSRSPETEETPRLWCWRKPALPPIVHVCRESRAATEAYSFLHGYQDSRGIEALSAAVWFRPEKEIVYLDTTSVYSVVYPDSEGHPPPESDPFDLSCVRNVGLHHAVINEENDAIGILDALYRRMPHVDTIYILVPRRCWVWDMGEPDCCCKLPCALVDMPNSFRGFDFDWTKHGNSQKIATSWPDVKFEITELMHFMAKIHEIPRIPELHSKFLVRPMCSGESGAPCQLIKCDWELTGPLDLYEADITGVIEDWVISKPWLDDAT